MQTAPPRAVAIRESSRVVVPTQLEHAVDAIGEQAAHRGRDQPVVDDDVIRAVRLKHRYAFRLAGRGDHGRVDPFGQDGGGEADRRRAAPDQQGLPRFQSKRGVQRAMRRLHHFGERAEGGPIERRFHLLDLRGRDERIFGVSTIENAPHPAHGGGDLVAGGEAATGRLDDLTDRLDAQDPWEPHVGRMPLTGEQLRAVQPESPHADQNPARLGCGDRPLL